MPEQAEWVGTVPVPSAQLDPQQRIADLEFAVRSMSAAMQQMSKDVTEAMQEMRRQAVEIQHLHEDIRRMKAGESQL